MMRLLRFLDRPWIRLSALLFVIALAGSVLTWRRASAAVSERALELGQHLQQVGDSVLGQTFLSLNGQTVHVTSIRSAKSLDALSRRFAALCPDASTDVREALASPPELTPPRANGLLEQGVFSFRSDSGQRALLCFGGATTFPQIASGAKRFLVSGDLTDIGPVRYLFASERDGRASGVLVQSHGSLDVRAMFPEDGDVPGGDLLGARPPHARRSLAIEAGGYAIRGYVSRDAPKVALAGYEQALHSAGFELSPLPVGPDAKRPMEIRIASNAADAFVVSAVADDEGALVSAVRIGSMATARAVP